MTNQQELLDKINIVETKLNDLYLPIHFKQMMTKIGHMESFISRAEKGVSNCYTTLFVIFIVFILFLLAVAFLFFKINYLRFFTSMKYRPNSRKTFRRKRSILYQEPTFSDGTQSSPE